MNMLRLAINRLRQMLVFYICKFFLFEHASTIFMTIVSLLYTVVNKLKDMKKVLFRDNGTGGTPSLKICRDYGSFEPVIDGIIQVHPVANNPTRAWEILQVKQTIHKLNHLPFKTPIDPKKVRFVCISDTHNKTDNLVKQIPDGDVLLHAGDFSMIGHPSQIEHFNNFLGKLPHKHKIVIAGNHELTFDPAFLEEGTQLRRFGMKPSDIKEYIANCSITRMADVLTNCTYLEDNEITIHGIKIYGAPWQPWFGDWGFNLERGASCLEKWNKIPENTDILITHGPPLGHGDMCFDKQRAGCVELLHTIQHRVKPKYHVFGHVHEGYGMTTDGVTKYVNPSTCTVRYKPCNAAIIFDIPLPPGVTKDDLSSYSHSDMEVNQ